jgi:putative ABC transport system permease protein
MNFTELFKVSLRSIKANKMRSFLTMLGIIIGVAAVIALVALAQGATSSVSSQIEGLGSNLLIITPGQATQGGAKMGAGSLDTLTTADSTALAKLSSVSGATPDVTKQGTVVAGNQSYTTTLEGASEQYETVRNAPVQNGRFFNQFEVNGMSNVAIVGTTVVENLFGNPNVDVTGETIMINGTPFTIIGVLQSQGASASSALSNDDKVIVPISTMMNRLSNSTTVRTIYVSAKSADAMTQTQFDIDQALRADHHLSPAEQDDFQINSQSQILSTAQGVTSILTTLLGGIAGISLIVGGIGIMNIMLVSVTERTREIGIRKAIGATKGVILTQFLNEAVMLSLLGGLIGIGIGCGGAVLASKLFNMTATITWTPILYSFLFSLLVGVVFGVYPARKASRLNPIDALRYE